MRLIVCIIMGVLSAWTWVACQSERTVQKPGKHLEETEMSELTGKTAAYPWDRRDILVFYALDSEDEEPRPGTLSLVMKDFLKLDKDNQVFLTDGAPYISVTTMEDLRNTIAKRKAAGGLSKEILSRLDQILAWMNKSGKKCVGYQAEPAEMAGDGTARAKGLKAEKEL